MVFQNMTINTLISILVPFYKGETYIEGCIKSIVEYSYKKVEILIINNGSSSGKNLYKHSEQEYPQASYY